MTGKDNHGFLAYADTPAFSSGWSSFAVDAPGRVRCAPSERGATWVLKRSLYYFARHSRRGGSSQTQSKKACRISSAFWLAAAVFSALVLRIRLPEASQPTTSLT